MGGDGMIYFDIPARKKYKRTELIGISVLKVDKELPPITYWAMSKKDFTSQGTPPTSITICYDFVTLYAAVGGLPATVMDLQHWTI
jgi:hypothetical protein